MAQPLNDTVQLDCDDPVPGFNGGGIDPATVASGSGGSDPAAISVHDSESDEEPPCDVAELFSPPRICARAEMFGLILGFSHDLQTHVDLSTSAGRAQSWGELHSSSPKALVVSPLCTWCSTIQNLNKRHYTEEIWARREDQARSLLNFAVACCKSQYDKRRWFIFEHPWKATSWQRGALVALAALDNVRSVDFDQCSTGLAGPNGQPIKKRTKLLTHIPSVISRFSQLQCSCSTKHLRIEGSCHGIPLSSYCQVYTRFLCDAILTCIHECIHGYDADATPIMAELVS